eukprot:09230.XXX_553700_553834_1 [CDS] Oithona nana genome sequencing.
MQHPLSWRLTHTRTVQRRRKAKLRLLRLGGKRIDIISFSSLIFV